MDNGAEALYIAAAVLVFMLALSLTLSSFSTFRNDLESFILADERADTAAIIEKDEDGIAKQNFINYISSSEECRTVGIESVVNSLYRVYKENYIVVIKLQNPDDYNAFTNSGGVLKDYSGMLIRGNDIKANIKKQDYIKDGNSKTLIGLNDTILVFSIPSAKNDDKYINKALDAGLYNLLKDKTFTEYTGVYYETDTVPIGTDLDNYDKDPNRNSVSTANKNKARVITYIEVKKDS